MKKTIQKIQQGFTLIELMIVVAIIGILASIAVPSYQTYTKKAKFSEIVLATQPYKIAVELCAQTTTAIGATTIAACAAATNGVPPDAGASGTVLSVVTIANGTITSTSDATSYGSSSVTYTLTPALSAGKVTWTVGGTCLSVGIC